jgi:hypothetical protein
MRPRPDQVLGILAQTLMLEVAPSVQGDYAQRSVQIAGMLLSMLQEQWDGAAERLAEENREIERIFMGALPCVADGALRRRLESALAAGPGAGLRLTALHARNDELRGSLVELQAHLEELTGPGPASSLEQIWRELVASTERRRLALAPF